MLRHPALIPPEYPIASEHECVDQYSEHAGPSTYSHDSSVDQFRRDGTLPPPAASPFPYAATHGTRMFSEGGVASDATPRYVFCPSLADVSAVSHPSSLCLGSQHFPWSVCVHPGVYGIRSLSLPSCAAAEASLASPLKLPCRSGATLGPDLQSAYHEGCIFRVLITRIPLALVAGSLELDVEVEPTRRSCYTHSRSAPQRRERSGR